MQVKPQDNVEKPVLSVGHCAVVCNNVECKDNSMDVPAFDEDVCCEVETEMEDIPKFIAEVSGVNLSLAADKRRDLLQGFCLYFILCSSILRCLKSFCNFEECVRLSLSWQEQHCE